MALYEYAFCDIELRVDNKLVEVFGETDMVKIKLDKVKSQDKKSPCGSVTRLINKQDKSAKMTVTLMMSSPSNKDFEALADTNASFPISLKTPFVTFEGTNSSVEEDPEYEYKTEISENVWMFNIPSVSRI